MLNRYLRVSLSILLLITSIACVDSAGYVNTIDLAGEWRVQPDGGKSFGVKVPGSLESQVAELRSFSGRAVYRKEFPIPQTWKGKRIVLRFGAVDWLADVSVNGRKAGSHEGGYTPFEFDITDKIKLGGWNDLQVAVTDVTPGRTIGTLVFDEIPHGRQGSFGPQSGIWQNVTIEALEPVAVSKVRVTPDVDRSVVVVNVSLSKASNTGELRLVVLGEGAAPHTTRIPLKAGQISYEAEIKLDAPELWEPDNPYLYKLQSRVRIGEYQTDPDVVEFGMRKIEVKDKRIYLNNQPIFVTGVLDQDYYPLTEYTPPSDEFLRTQFQRAKQMGINLVRCQAKIPDPRYLEWADRVGLIVWYEMPGFGKLNQRSQTRAKLLLTEALKRDYNHASLCMVSLMGDGWGADTANPEHRTWQRVMYESAKSLDPTRLMIDNSSSDTYHIKTDIEDLHHKLSAPEHSGEFATWVSTVVKSPGSSFSPLGDSLRRGDEPIFISGGGKWGLPKISEIKKTYNGEPWWFGSGSGASKAEGVEQRFKDQGLDRVFGSMDALAEACQWRQWESLKYRIEQMRKHPEVSGYVLSQLSDVQWESDGLLDANRAPKVFFDKVKCSQSADAIIPDLQGTANCFSGARFSMDVLVSHMSRNKLQDCRLTWRLEGLGVKGTISKVSVGDQSVAKVGTISFTVPTVKTPSSARIVMTLASPTGATITENYLDINIFPATKPASGQRVVVWDPDGKLKDFASRLSSAGYSITEAKDEGLVILTGRLDEQVRALARKGGRVILVASEADSIPNLATSDLAVVPRDASGRWGDWSKCFLWVRDAGPMRNVAFGPGNGSKLSAMTPKTVLTGLDMAKDRDDVFGGVFVGWLQYPAAVAAQFSAGEGKVLATTLDLFSAYGKDPAATTLLGDMIAYVSGSEFSPTMKIDLTQTAAENPDTEFGSEGWRFTTDAPGETWTEVGFTDGGWKSFTSAVGSSAKPGAVVLRTVWEPSDLWMRKTQQISGSVKRGRIIYISDEPFEAYLNGKLVLKVDIPASQPQKYDLSVENLQLLKPGKNVLAVHTRQVPGGRQAEISLRYDVK